MKLKKYVPWLILIVLLYSAWATPSASAHGVLIRSNPAANAVLEQPPVQVELFFTETLEPRLSSIQVFDSNNAAVDAGDVRVDPSDPTRMTVTLHRLSDGVYTVTWKALSTVDGHQTVGTFPFAVGKVNAAVVSGILQSTTARLPFSALVAKFLLLASLAILMGQRLFIALVWNPALKSDQSGVSKPDVWAKLYRIGLIGVLLSIGVGILSQAGQAVGAELSYPWNLHTGHILTGTRLGVIWLARLALAILAVWLAGWQESPLRDWAGFVVNLALLLSVALTSHAATELRPFFPVLGDWLHLIGMTFWLGGLIHLFTGIRQLQGLDDRTRTSLISLLTSRFSINAILFVSLIGITGFYSAYLRVGAWPALLTSLYGHVLLIKQGFVAGLLLIAATNLLVISPRLRRNRLQNVSDSKLISRFGKILVLELTFAGLLLASVSFLTYIPPAKAVSLNSDVTGTARADDLRLKLSISPGRVGQNTFTLQLASSGQPVQFAKEVLLRFTPAQGNIPPSELQLIGLGDGKFVAKGSHLGLPGNWQIQAVVRREDKFDAFADFKFTIRAAGATEETSTIPAQAALLIIATGILCGLMTGYVKVKPVLRWGIGVPLTMFMLILGIVDLVSPLSVVNVQANPIPPNSESIAKGQELYSAKCVPCHGVTGKGDGPIGLTLNPRPANLTQHAIPGIHPDSQLFEWITNGFPGSQMPAFKSTLSDTDRWHLVNFIRTLSPQ